MRGWGEEQTWAVMTGLGFIVLVLCVTFFEYSSNQQDSQVRVECVKAGGEVGTERGRVTCTQPAP